MADRELYPGQFADLQPLPEWTPVPHRPGVLRAQYRGFALETQPSAERRNGQGQLLGLIDGAVREWHDEGPYLRFLLLQEAARMARARDRSQ